MILSLTLNPSVDRTVFIDGLKVHESNRVSHTETDAGGKGLNLSRIAHECGAKTTALAYLGGEPAAMVRRALRLEEVPFVEIPIVGYTRLNVTIEDGSGEPPTSLNEKGPTISPDERAAFWVKFEELLPDANWVAMGGSIPPGLQPNEYAELLKAARKSGAKVLVDADGEALRLALAEKPDLIKPNREEISKLLGRSIYTIDQALAAAKELHDSGIPRAMISMGVAGVAYVDAEDVFVGVPPQIEPCSTIGSGDSLLGGFLASLQAGGSTEDALRLGMACGAATATTSGAEIARKETIDALIDRVRIERR